MCCICITYYTTGQIAPLMNIVLFSILSYVFHLHSTLICFPLWLSLASNTIRLKLYTIRNLESLLQKHQNYSSIVSMHHKRLFIDKCNWFITHIIKSQIKIEKGLGELVNIHSKVLQTNLGNRYNSIVDALADIEIVYMNEKYSSARTLKANALSPRPGSVITLALFG